ncbi:hypothetical protein IIA79_08375 [bacterium]|nr:hypothetical protein [bacterium]
MRLTIILCLVLAVVLSKAADAISPSNREKLAKHFQSLGTVTYELYSAYGGPEIGGAVIENSDQSSRLLVVQVGARGGIADLYAGTLMEHAEEPPFTFMAGGNHLLTYPTTAWAAKNGSTLPRGDLVIQDLSTPGGPKVIFELKDVVDLSFEVYGVRFQDKLIWQPMPHFLNSGNRLPLKFQYFRLSWDEEAGDYKLYHHLAPMPDAAISDTANMNNRALAYYYMGRIKGATRLLQDASRIAETHQSLVSRNQSLLKSELAGLAVQGQLRPDQPFDDALLHYWRGEFTACLNVLDRRQRAGLSDEDLALLGLALAQEERWPDVDKFTPLLEGRNTPFFADYLAEVLTITSYQHYPGIETNYLRALEDVEPNHPVCITGKARLLARLGDLAQAKQILEDYLANQQYGEHDPAVPRLALFKLYSASGNTVGRDELIRDAASGPIMNLAGLVDLIDYQDLSSAMADVPPEYSDRIPVPKTPLDSISMPDQLP